MPVVVVATMVAKPEAVDVFRDVLTRAIPEVHREPGCELYALHHSDRTFVFIEQWADQDALDTHGKAPVIGAMFNALEDLIDGAPDIKFLTPVVTGDPAKGRLRP
jgi:quinol monooxygenase YgiN